MKLINLISALELVSSLHCFFCYLFPGMNTGPVVAGVIGKKKWAYGSWFFKLKFLHTRYLGRLCKSRQQVYFKLFWFNIKQIRKHRSS